MCVFVTYLFLALAYFDLLLAVATHWIYSLNSLPFKLDYVSAFFEAIEPFDLKEICRGEGFLHLWTHNKPHLPSYATQFSTNPQMMGEASPHPTAGL